MNCSSNKTYNIYRIIIVTFIVTGIWDVILRTITLYKPVPYIHEMMPFMKD